MIRPPTVWFTLSWRVTESGVNVVSEQQLAIASATLGPQATPKPSESAIRIGRYCFSQFVLVTVIFIGILGQGSLNW